MVWVTDGVEDFELVMVLLGVVVLDGVAVVVGVVVADGAAGELPPEPVPSTQSTGH